jgi:hypothetical protein
MQTPSTTSIPSNGVTTTIASVTLDSGKYLLFINYYPTISGTISVATLNYNISTTIGSYTPNIYNVAPIGNSNYPPLSLVALSTVVTPTTTTTYYFNASNQYTGAGSMTIGGIANITFYAVRIA